MSNKYKEEISKIVMNDDMKRRILQNVLEANENSEEKNIKVETTVPKVKKYNKLKRNMQIIAASVTIVSCLSVAKNYPMLLKNTPSDLEQNEIAKSHDDENDDSKTSNDNGFVYNKDSKETSNNDNKEDQTLRTNNNIKNNGDTSEKEDSDTSSEIKKEDKSKDKLQSNSGPEVEKSQSSNDDNAIGNSNILPKINPNEDVNNKENKNLTNTEQKTKPGDIMLDKVPENNADDNTSGKSAITEKSINYNQEYKTLGEAEKALDLKVTPLKTVPKGFKMKSINVISNEIIQIEYSDGTYNITFRAGKGIDNISGDYNVYQVKKTAKLNGINVNLEGNKREEYNLAVWENESISYSISAENGIDEKTILDMIL